MEDQGSDEKERQKDSKKALRKPPADPVGNFLGDRAADGIQLGLSVLQYFSEHDQERLIAKTLLEPLPTSAGFHKKVLYDGSNAHVITFQGTSQLKKVRRSVKRLKELTHPCVVGLYGLAVDGHLVHIVTEHVGFCASELVERVEKQKTGWAEEVVLPLLLDVASAFKYIHSCGYTHRDLHPGNVLCFKQGKVFHGKVCGFNYATRKEKSSSTSLSNTPARYAVYTIAPEVFGNRRHGGLPADVFAFGVLAYALCIGEPERTLDKSLTLSKQRPDHISAQLWDVLRFSLQTDPRDRLEFPTIHEQLKALAAGKKPKGGNEQEKQKGTLKPTAPPKPSSFALNKSH